MTLYQFNLILSILLETIHYEQEYFDSTENQLGRYGY